MVDAVPEPQEVTLADLVRTLWNRKWVLVATFLLVLGGGVAYTLLQTPQYTAKSTLVGLEQQDILQRWLESRQAATWVANDLGDPLLSVLFPSEWDAPRGDWRSLPPSDERAGRAVAELVDVSTTPPVSGRVDRTIRVTVTFEDPALARDIANAYLDSLQVVRPTLQNVTESALFQQFYDGQNAQDARRQAHDVALEREYWIVLDPAYTPTEPSSPNVTLNVALSIVLGLLLGVVAAFTAQWIASYRLASRPPVLPGPPGAAPPKPPTGGEPGGAGSFRYRGR